MKRIYPLFACCFFFIFAIFIVKNFYNKKCVKYERLYVYMEWNNLVFIQLCRNCYANSKNFGQALNCVQIMARGIYVFRCTLTLPLRLLLFLLLLLIVAFWGNNFFFLLPFSFSCYFHLDSHFHTFSIIDLKALSHINSTNELKCKKWNGHGFIVMRINNDLCDASIIISNIT